MHRARRSRVVRTGTVYIRSQPTQKYVSALIIYPGRELPTLGFLRRKDGSARLKL